MSTRVSVATLRRKNLVLDQAKINRAKHIFAASTETEAIDRALDQAAELSEFWRELDRGLDGLIGRGGFSDRFGKRTR